MTANTTAPDTETIVSTHEIGKRRIDVKRIASQPSYLYFAVDGCNESFIGDHVSHERVLEEVARIADYYADKLTYNEETNTNYEP
jgi:hypothetical protein